MMPRGTSFWQTVLNADWAWTTLAWVLLIASAALLGWALFRSRPGLWGVPRLRCPKCWYDMQGAVRIAAIGSPADGVRPSVGFACPECGKTIASEKKLRKIRRRWGVALLAVPMLVGWYLAEHKELIRRQGWVSVVPTVVLMVMVDVEDWYALTDQERQINRQPKTLADQLHQRLVRSDVMMSLWLVRAGGYLKSQGITVIDARDVAPVRTGRVVWPWTSIPLSGDHLSFRFHGTVVDDTFPEAFRYLIVASIDQNGWIDNGGDWNGPTGRAGDRLLIRATPDVLRAIELLVEVMRRATAEPALVHETRIHGMNFVVLSLDYFDRAAWFAERLSRETERERLARARTESAAALGLGGGGGGSGPWGGGRELYGESYAVQSIRNEYRWSILRALQYETSQRYWVDFGGRDIRACWIGELLVIYSDGWNSAHFAPALVQIHDRGPDAIIAEHESDR